MFRKRTEQLIKPHTKSLSSRQQISKQHLVEIIAIRVRNKVTKLENRINNNKNIKKYKEGDILLTKNYKQ